MANSSEISVKPYELAAKNKEALENYVVNYDQLVIGTADDIAKEVKAELKSISPKDTGEYAKGWVLGKQKGKNYYRRIIWNKPHYRRVHLLEFGHATRNGSRVPAQPHVQKTELKYIQKFVNELKTKTRGGI